MTLAGGSADKLGNRYEGYWTVWQMLQLLDEQTSALTPEILPLAPGQSILQVSDHRPNIHVEPLGSPGFKAEFIVHGQDGRLAHHQVKTRGRQRWTLNALQREGLLSAFFTKLDDPLATCVLVSDQNADDLSNLCARARLVSTADTFVGETLSAELKSAWIELTSMPIYGGWAQCGAEEAYERLKRIRVQVVDPETLLDWVNLGIRSRVTGSPSQVRLTLADLAVSSIHRQLTALDLWTMLADEGFQRQQWHEDPRLVSRMAAATARCLGATDEPSRHGGPWIERQDLARLIQRLQDFSTAQLVLVTGGAGLGKSEVVLEAARHFQTLGWPTLALRLDRLDPVRTAKDLGLALELPESPAEVLARVAAGRPALLVIDQLDAVSTVSGRHPEFFEVVEELVRQVRARPNIRVLLACRKFDLDFDDRLQRLESADVHQNPRIDIQPFTQTEVGTLLGQAGIGHQLTPIQLKVLTIPLNFRLFFQGWRLGGGRSFQNANDLYERYWQLKEANVQRIIAAFSLANALEILLTQMNERMALSLPSMVLDRLGRAGGLMVSEGLLQRDGARVAFFHEGFFDYAFARHFIASGQSLLSLLRSTEQHLFRRAQVRQVLVLQRDSDPEAYEDALATVLSAPDIRFHLKQLILELLATVESPTAREQAVLKVVLAGTDEDLRREARGLAGRSPGWFQWFIEQGLLPSWLESQDDFLVSDAALALMNQLETSPDAVLEFLEPYLEDSAIPKHLFMTVLNRERAFQHRRPFDLFLKLIVHHELAEKSAWPFLEDVAEVRPAWSCEGLGALLERGLVRVREFPHLPLLSSYSPSVMNNTAVASRTVEQSSAAEPVLFLSHILPRLLEAASLSPAKAQGDFCPDRIWSGRDASDRVPRLSKDLVDGVIRALGQLDIITFREYAALLRGNPLEVAQFILLKAYKLHAAAFADDAIEDLCASPQRLEIGYSSQPEWVSHDLLRAVTPHASPQSLQHLEHTLLFYAPAWERRADHRAARGLAELALLDGIIPDRRSLRIQQRLGELRRKFPTSDPTRLQPTMWSGTATSPLPEAATARMTDQQWITAMETYPGDGRSRRFKTGMLFGGALELARALQTRVQHDPERFARLALAMPASLNPTYFSHIILGLREVDLAPELVMQVARRCAQVAGEESGRWIPDLFARRPDLDWPDEVLELLAWSAVHDSNPSEDLWLRNIDGQDPYSSGINSTRGQMAEGIGHLLFSRPERLKAFRPSLEELVADPVVAVRACVGLPLLASLDHDGPWAVEQFLRLVQTRDELLTSPHVVQFLKYGLLREYDRLRPVLERMLNSSIDEAVQKGAMLACLTAFHLPEADELALHSCTGSVPQRLGAAEVYGSNLNSPTVRHLCRERLIQLFRDPDASVREEAAKCFRLLEDQPPDFHGSLIETFVQTKSFQETPFFLLYFLKRSRQQLPLVLVDVAESYIVGAGPEATDLRSARAGDTTLVSELIMRVYSQTLNRPVDQQALLTRCLNVFDRLARWREHRFATLLTTYER